MVNLMSKKGKVVRVILGLIIIGFGIYYKSLFGLIGLIPILFVAINFCPLCYFKGICKISK